MSLNLTALRLQAIEALNSHPTIAALCPGRVYDSRVGDFDQREPVPVIIVTSEELEGDALSHNNGGLPFRDMCDLVLEVAMNVLDGDGDDAFIGAPATDREMEASLNLISWCAEQMLTTGRPYPLARPTPAGLILTRAVTRRVHRRRMTRFANDQTGEKLAIHLITYRVEVKTETPDARALPTGTYAALPDPLRTVCAAATDPSAQQVCRMLAAAVALPTLVPLQTGTFDPAKAPADPPPGAQPPDLTFPFPGDA
ncbi:hypothetical protein MFUR16E_04715 [Methylobacterium fujisawaense]|uniref:hypothetical protein n=1 Tax=Methylobacterium fujisawaense TaxID=107400 RepID=UPI002F2BAD51